MNVTTGGKGTSKANNSLVFFRQVISRHIQYQVRQDSIRRSRRDKGCHEDSSEPTVGDIDMIQSCGLAEKR